MKSFSYYLTSSKLPPLQPAVLEHWFFSDPTYGVTFTYPSTTYCGELTTLSACELPTDSCFTNTICGGYFFPWGYQVLTEVTDAVLGYRGQFKGDTTITFIPSGLDITYHDVFKIAYDFSDGTSVIEQKGVIPQQIFNSVDQFTTSNDYNSPKFRNVSHIFYASSGPVTFTPTITVFYGDCTFVLFNLSFNIVPNSIYEIDNVHLINTIQLPKLKNSNFNIFEIESESQITNVILTENPAGSATIVRPLSSVIIITFDGDNIITFDGEPILTIPY